MNANDFRAIDNTVKDGRGRFAASNGYTLLRDLGYATATIDGAIASGVLRRTRTGGVMSAGRWTAKNPPSR